MIRPSARLLWSLLALGCLMLAVGSLILVTWMDLRPCPLCIFQRTLFMVLGLLALAAAWLGPRAAALFPGLLSLIGAAGGIGIASYQIWLQLQPPESASCGGGPLAFIDVWVDWLGERLPQLFLATGFCEEPGPLILGLTLPHWALVGFSGYLLVALWAISVRRRP
ncbi:disulfide bond formation protein B [uncultured Thiodictyon sp.]|uniref:disulfide bond formation protein B n=1 Tax=uncultured Thiodictyon sp. TaxID=1846217 RepID=UPI0025E5A077|nr:disulfide bond formation protein B [uncultured Thiodictyon sp.]